MHNRQPEDFDSLMELLDYFNTEEKCLKYFQYKRWGDMPTCPHCNNTKCYRFSDGKRFKCSGCRKQFTVRIGTIFEDSNLPLRKWFIAIYLVTCHKKGISSYQLARDIKTTQDTAWFMLHRIRHKLGIADPEHQLEGTIQLDETFVGGKNKNRHKDKKVGKSQGRSFKDKTPVMGMLQQKEIEVIDRPHKLKPLLNVRETIIVKESFVRCRKTTDTSVGSLQPVIKENVVPGTILVSDEWCGYQGLDTAYDHRVIDHRAKQYVDEAGNTTNALEGFWTLFKRAYMGIYHYMSRKHMQRYADEVAYRYNTKNMKDCDRFRALLSLPDSPLKYKDLIKKAA